MAAEATGAIQGTAMEISVSKFELLKELTATQGVVERKTTIPILSNFLFEAANDRLTITATDLDLSLRTSRSCGCFVAEPPNAGNPESNRQAITDSLARLYPSPILGTNGGTH